MEQIKTHNNAGFCVRALAKIEDGLLGLVLLLGGTLLSTLAPLGGDHAAALPLAVGASLLLLYFPLSGLYNMYFVSKYGGTIGKLIFGLKIRRDDNEEFLDRRAAFLRTILGYIYSSKFFGAGYLKIIKSDDNIAWHDELFSTHVEKSGSIWPGIGVLILTIAAVVGLSYLLVLNFPVL